MKFVLMRWRVAHLLVLLETDSRHRASCRPLPPVLPRQNNVYLSFYSSDFLYLTDLFINPDERITRVKNVFVMISGHGLTLVLGVKTLWWPRLQTRWVFLSFRKHQNKTNDGGKADCFGGGGGGTGKHRGLEFPRVLLYIIKKWDTFTYRLFSLFSFVNWLLYCLYNLIRINRCG